MELRPLRERDLVAGWLGDEARQVEPQDKA